MPETTSDEDNRQQKQRRRYLKSAERKQEIRDAALVEFSNHGYAATTMHSIAKRAGMSKTGIYSHYKSKEEVFEDLLMTVLTLPPSKTVEQLETHDYCLHDIVENYVEQLYSVMDEPRTQSVFELLVTENRRAPDVVRRWYQNVVEVRIKNEKKIVDECVARGIMRESVLSECFTLSVSPFIHASLQQLLLKDDSPMSISQMRKAHKKLMLEMLQPR